MPYLVGVLAFSFIVVLIVSLRNQSQIRKSNEELFSLVQLILPVSLDRMRELFDPAEEWNLKVNSTSKDFQTVQKNRRQLAIRYAAHMYRNAQILQRLGYAGIRSRRADQVVKGKMLVDAGVPVRLRSAMLLGFLRLQQLVHTGSNLNAVRDLVKDLVPEYSALLQAASNLIQEIDPRLHESLAGLI